MRSQELIDKYLNFFKKKGHAVIPNVSLVPKNDPTVLFTTAGMHPLIPYLLGEKHPLGDKLVNVQKCIRTTDIDSVGDEFHLTFFEMLGNWSLGSYFKEESISWSFEFLTKELNIPLNRLAVSCFEGDKEVPKDEESALIWQKLGLAKDRIYFFGQEDNWWGPAGKTGPCGPDTEIFYWIGEGEPLPLKKSDQWVEIWNNVFMPYNKTADGHLELLKQKNVDTGMGVERTIAVLSGYKSVYETNVFYPLIDKLAEISKQKYEGDNVRIFRIISDHLKAAAFILNEGIEPSNVEQGYVIRRLIRRAIRYGKQLGLEKVFTPLLVDPICEIYQVDYLSLEEKKDFIKAQLIQEEEKFRKTLNQGLKKIERLRPAEINGHLVFDLYQTNGFPAEMFLEELKKRKIDYDPSLIIKEFEEEMKKHQLLSRAGSEHKFKGGLADHSEQATKYHTAAHLMLAALRIVLGDDVYQKGSNITAQRLRFDFSHPKKLTEEEIQQVEEIVNQKIKENLPVQAEEMSLDEAKRIGAMGVFEDRYGERVKVYLIGSLDAPFSREICGGPHVKSTGELGYFKIIKEESVSSGVRRIKAILS